MGRCRVGGSRRGRLAAGGGVVAGWGGQVGASAWRCSDTVARFPSPPQVGWRHQETVAELEAKRKVKVRAGQGRAEGGG